MITLARFRSEEAVKVDNDLPEQGAWIEVTSKAFEGEVTFHDCREVDSLLDGGSDDAGLVQIMQGRAKDEKQMRHEPRRTLTIQSEGAPNAGTATTKTLPVALIPLTTR
jgi:hypothetical protein